MEIRKEIPSLNDKDSDILILISDQHSILTNKQTLIAQLVKNPTCRRPWFDSWVRKISWRRERLPIPAFWPGELHGLYSPWGCKELDTTEQLSLSGQVKRVKDA